MTSVHYAVLTHNRWRSLAKLMGSVACQSVHRRTRITIFDNGSCPEHAQAVAEIADAHGATVVRSSTNLEMSGRRALEDHIFAAGVNADVLVHLDDDVVLHEDWLRAALVGLSDDHIVACGSVEDSDGDLVISGQRTIELHHRRGSSDPPALWRWAWHKPDEDLATTLVDLAGHRALAVRSGVANAVRHDPVLTAGGDDIDYSLSLRRQRGTLAVARDAIIVHRSLGEPDAHRRTRESVIASWRQFHRKWGFVREGAAAEVDMSVDDFLAAILHPAGDEPPHSIREEGSR